MTTPMKCMLGKHCSYGISAFRLKSTEILTVQSDDPGVHMLIHWTTAYDIGQEQVSFVMAV